MTDEHYEPRYVLQSHQGDTLHNPKSFLSLLGVD